MANLTDADKVLRNDTGKDIVAKLDAIKTAIENGGGGGGGGGSSITKSATLTAGTSSVSITDNIISEYGTLPSSGGTSCLSFFVYTDMPGLAPYSKSISGHTLTLKFVPQLTDVNVYVAFQMCAL